MRGRRRLRGISGRDGDEQPTARRLDRDKVTRLLPVAGIGAPGTNSREWMCWNKAHRPKNKTCEMSRFLLRRTWEPKQQKKDNQGRLLRTPGCKVRSLNSSKMRPASRKAAAAAGDRRRRLEEVVSSGPRFNQQVTVGPLSHDLRSTRKSPWERVGDGGKEPPATHPFFPLLYPNRTPCHQLAGHMAHS